MNKENDSKEYGEDASKYGEFILSYFAWLSPEEQKQKTEKPEKRPRNGSTGSVESRKTDPFRFPVPDDSTDPGGGTGSPRRKSIPFPVPAGWRAEHVPAGGGCSILQALQRACYALSAPGSRLNLRYSVGFSYRFCSLSTIWLKIN